MKNYLEEEREENKKRFRNNKKKRPMTSASPNKLRLKVRKNSLEQFEELFCTKSPY
jgi:hypothetical protein